MVAIPVRSTLSRLMQYSNALAAIAVTFEGNLIDLSRLLFEVSVPLKIAGNVVDS